MRIRSSLCFLAVASALLIAACGGSSSTTSTTSTSAGGSSKLTTVKVGVLPISALAPLYLGVQQHIFAKHGLKLEPKVAQAGAAIVPAVQSGEEQFGFANVVSLMIANDKGLPIKLVAQGSQAGPGKSSRFEGVIVKGSSPIKSPKDLAGKTIAVNSLNDIGGLLISGALEKKGVDPKSIHYTEVAFPDVNGAVADGRVDAAYQTEPFLTQALASGDRVALYQYPVLGDEITIAGYFTTEKMIETQPDTVRRFRAAMNESLTYAQQHEDQVRKIVTTFTKIPPEAAQKMVLPSWHTSLEPSSSGLALVAGLAKQQKLVSSDFDLGDLIAR